MTRDFTGMSDVELLARISMDWEHEEVEELARRFAKLRARNEAASRSAVLQAFLDAVSALLLRLDAGYGHAKDLRPLCEDIRRERAKLAEPTAPALHNCGHTDGPHTCALRVGHEGDHRALDGLHAWLQEPAPDEGRPPVPTMAQCLAKRELWPGQAYCDLVRGHDGDHRAHPLSITWGPTSRPIGHADPAPRAEAPLAGGERWSEDYRYTWHSSDNDAASRGGICVNCKRTYGLHRAMDGRCPARPEPAPAPACPQCGLPGTRSMLNDTKFLDSRGHSWWVAPAAPARGGTIRERVEALTTEIRNEYAEVAGADPSDDGVMPEDYVRTKLEALIDVLDEVDAERAVKP